MSFNVNFDNFVLYCISPNAFEKFFWNSISWKTSPRRFEGILVLTVSGGGRRNELKSSKVSSGLGLDHSRITVAKSFRFSARSFSARARFSSSVIFSFCSFLTLSFLLTSARGFFGFFCLISFGIIVSKTGSAPGKN